MARPADIAIVALSVALIASVTYRARSQSAGPPVVYVEAQGSAWVYPLETDRDFEPLSAEGACQIRIERETVRVVASDCPQKICMAMGAIAAPGQWIACLPHQVFIDIRGESVGGQVDGVSM